MENKKEKHNNKKKEERLTSVNWKEEHHQLDVKITSTSNRQPLQIQLRPKETLCRQDCRCTKNRWLLDWITFWAGPIDTAHNRQWCGEEPADEEQRFVAEVLIPYGSPLAGDVWVGNRTESLDISRT